jgi:hypothetical protein
MIHVYIIYNPPAAFTYFMYFHTVLYKYTLMYRRDLVLTIVLYCILCFPARFYIQPDYGYICITETCSCIYV